MAKKYKPSRYRTSSSQSQTLWVFFISLILIFGFLHYSQSGKEPSIKESSLESEKTTLAPFSSPLIPLPDTTVHQHIENTRLFTPRFKIN